MQITNNVIRTLTAGALAAAMTSSVQAADELNVAFFLEWATPNMIAKSQKAYEEALGVPVNWVNFDAGTAMTEAMLAGDIDISYSQGLAPFITAVNSGAPIVTVGVAVTYSANACVVANGIGIDANNASELEGKTVALPIATMADYSFRMQMQNLDVDIDKITIVDQVPADAVVSLGDGSVDMACIFGGNATKDALEHGAALMSSEDMTSAGIIAFDVVAVTESFATSNPDLLKTFMQVTNDANNKFATDGEGMDLIMRESGMDEDTATNQMADMGFPTSEQQLNEYFNDGGLAAVAFEVVGGAFATDENPAMSDYSAVIDTSFLE